MPPQSRGGWLPRVPALTQVDVKKAMPLLSLKFHPTVGVARVVSAASAIGLAVGYNVDSALEHLAADR
jgi:hypothetical protein